MAIVKGIVAIQVNEELICLDCASKEEIREATADCVFDRGWVNRNVEASEDENGTTFIFCCRCEKQI